MNRATLLALCAAFAATSAAAQSGPLKSCPLLADADAALATGGGTQFLSARQSPSGGVTATYCAFGGDKDRSLTLTAGPLLAASVADYRKMMEPLRQMEKAALESGLGEYAYSKLSADAAEITAAKGKLALSLELKGKGLAAADLEKLRAVARKALARMP
jgi:hypothetical protein